MSNYINDNSDQGGLTAPSPVADVVTPKPVNPSIGRIVLYNTTDEDRDLFENLNVNISQQLPAIVTSVWDADMVNLIVFTDGAQSNLFKPSVSLATEGGEQGYWEWPKRV